MHLARACFAHHLYDLHRGRAADDGIIDQHDPLAAGDGAVGGNGLCECMPSSSNTTISPFSTSRTYFAPMMSRAQVSEARIGCPSSLPMTSGRMPKGSRAPSSFLLVRPTNA